MDQLNEFLLAPNTTVRLQLRTQIIQHLDKIERLSQGLQLAERRQLAVILQDSRTLLAELDNALYNMFLVREKVSELSARIDWLHDDFTTELNSLVQDFTWQQGTLLDQIEANQATRRSTCNVRARCRTSSSRYIPWRELKIRLLTTCATD